MKKIPRKDYEAWNWLKIENWTVDKIMGPILGNKIMCKICDEYVIMQESQKHLARHISQRKRQIKEDRKKAHEERLEKMRRAREEKMAGKLSS